MIRNTRTVSLLARIVPIVITCIFVTACATNAQRQAQAIQQSNEVAKDKARTCMKVITDGPEYQLIRRHIPTDIRHATLEQLMDKSLITEEEIAVVHAVHPKIQTCREQLISQISTTTPTVGTILTLMFTKGDRSLVDLLQKKKSWGEHLQSVKDILAYSQNEIVAEEQRIKEGLNQSHANELQQRQAAANALTQFVQTQQMINAMYRPTFTNCTGFGNTVNCITQ